MTHWHLCCSLYHVYDEVRLYATEKWNTPEKINLIFNLFSVYKWSRFIFANDWSAKILKYKAKWGFDW